MYEKNICSKDWCFPFQVFDLLLDMEKSRADDFEKRII